MSGTRLAYWAVVMIALVALGTGELLAKKPSPPPPPEPDPDPAIAYKTVERKAEKLWVMNADGSNRTLLVTATSATISRADWSPDGDQLVFGSTMGGSPGIWVVDVDGTGLWLPYKSFVLKAGETIKHDFREAFSAYWVRAVSNAETTATVTFTYN